MTRDASRNGGAPSVRQLASGIERQTQL
jgi:hypothetical protein